MSNVSVKLKLKMNRNYIFWNCDLRAKRALFVNKQNLKRYLAYKMKIKLKKSWTLPISSARYGGGCNDVFISASVAMFALGRPAHVGFKPVGTALHLGFHFINAFFQGQQSELSTHLLLQLLAWLLSSFLFSFHVSVHYWPSWWILFFSRNYIYHHF